MVFIDADKQNYPAYLDWADKHVRKGGLIVADNTFLFGHVYGEESTHVREGTKEAMLCFNERLADVSKYTSIILPTKEGLSIAMKRF